MLTLDKLDTDQIRSHELGALNALVDICERHGLRCLLAYGTLIGAARHEGFIPWDDDVDVWMPADDYWELVRIVASGEDRLADPYRFAATGIEHPAGPHHIWFGKVYDMGTLVRQENLAPSVSVDEGCWVDVFPYTTLPSEERWRTLQPEFARLQRRVEQSLFIAQPGSNPLHTLRKKVAGAVMKAKGYPAFLSEYDALLRSLPPHPGDPLVFDPAACDTVFDASWFAETTSLPFEGRSYPAPAGWRQVLDRFYGDWEALPPEEDRVRHSFAAYRR